MKNFCIFPKENGKLKLGFEEEDIMIGIEFLKIAFSHEDWSIILRETRMDAVGQL